jgi:hypothetical protein
VNDLQPKGNRDHCLNCNAKLKPLDAYCSSCGQKVDDNKLGIGDVSREFFENYISLDSRFGRTIIPFLIKPGYLSKQFIEGKRRSFANPFRLYIISSILFFFSLTAFIDFDEGPSKPIFKVKETQLADFSELSESSYQSLNSNLSSKAKEQLNQYEDSSFSKAYDSLKPIHQKAIVKSLGHEQLKQLTLLQDTSLVEGKVNNNVALEGTAEENHDLEVKEILRYKDSTHISDEELYKMIKADKKVPFYKEVLYKQFIRLSRSDNSRIRRYLLGNLSLAMFVLIPLFALFLKLFYYRRNSYYVAHLIHTIYLQSFAFVIFGIILLLGSSFDVVRAGFSFLIAIGSLLFIIYFFKSLRRLYLQSRLLTFFKGILLMHLYCFLAFVALLGEVLVSFLIY